MCDHDRATGMSNSDAFHVKHPRLHHRRRQVRTWCGSSIARSSLSRVRVELMVTAVTLFAALISGHSPCVRVCAESLLCRRICRDQGPESRACRASRGRGRALVRLPVSMVGGEIRRGIEVSDAGGGFASQHPARELGGRDLCPHVAAGNALQCPTIDSFPNYGAGNFDSRFR